MIRVMGVIARGPQCYHNNLMLCQRASTTTDEYTRTYITKLYLHIQP